VYTTIATEDESMKYSREDVRTGTNLHLVDRNDPGSEVFAVEEYH